MSRPLLLDLFAGGGGCSAGYARAGFEVIGSDKEPHPVYPFEFHVADALEVLDRLVATGEAFGRRPDVVAASPPCKRFTSLAALHDDMDDRHPDLLTPTRDRLLAWGGRYVIENVVGAPLRGPLMLCGSEFGLGTVCADGVRRQLRRHRLFESNVWLMGAGGCQHRGAPVGVYGHGGDGGDPGKGYQANAAEAAAAMGIDWMRHYDVVQAIPPAYTEFIGEQLLAALTDREDTAA